MKRILLILILCSLLAGCATRVIVVPDSEQVLYVGQGESVPAPWDAVLLSRGHYMQLMHDHMAYEALGRPEP